MNKAFLTMIIAAACGCQTSQNATPSAHRMCYVGSNSGSPDKQAIRVLDCDVDTGAITAKWDLKGVQGTTYFAFNNDRTRLYTMMSDPEIKEGPKGAIVAYAVLGDELREINRISLGCGTPCFIAYDGINEDKLIFADYGGAVSGVVKLNSDGAIDVSRRPITVRHEGKGPRADRQEAAHAHCAFFLPGTHNRYFGVVDLGIDQIRFYDLGNWRDGDGTISNVKEMTITLPAGFGPRHVAFDEKHHTLFVINELGNTVCSYKYTAELMIKHSGRKIHFELAGAKISFRPVDTVNMLPADFKDFSKAAAIKLTEDGKILMASNRGHDSIAFYEVSPDGHLKLRNIAKLTGAFPRDFELMPGEKFMIVGHKMSNEVQVYRFDREACTLTPVGDAMPLWRPLCFKFR